LNIKKRYGAPVEKHRIREGKAGRASPSFVRKEKHGGEKGVHVEHRRRLGESNSMRGRLAGGKEKKILAAGDRCSQREQGAVEKNCRALHGYHWRRKGNWNPSKN